MGVLKILDVNKFLFSVQAKEVTSAALFSKNKFDTAGLFSEEIFGLEFSLDRKRKYGFIQLHVPILHPLIYEVIKKLNQKLLTLIDGEQLYYDEKNKIIVNEPNENTKVVSGFDGLMYILQKGYNFEGGSEVRDALIKELNNILKSGLYKIDKIIVIPPHYRPIFYTSEGEILNIDELNFLYIKVLNLAQKAKFTKTNDKTDEFSESSLIRKELQNLVNSIFNLAKLKLAKKEGLLRGDILGKRVDFSARAVACAGSNIPVGYIGTPYSIIANIAQPFIIFYITKTLNKTSEEYQKIKNILYKYKYIDDLNIEITNVKLKELLSDMSLFKISFTPDEEQFIINLFQKVVKDKYVLVKRDPSLHKGNWQSFKPFVIPGRAIQFNISMTTLFNLDFDGDQLAVFLPLSLEAQEEARIMHVPYGSRTELQTSIEIKHELLSTAYIMNVPGELLSPKLKFSLEELRNKLYIGIEDKYHVWQQVELITDNKKKINTNLGAAIFNAIFPAEFLIKYYDGFIQYKSDIINNDIIPKLYNEYEIDILTDIVTTLVQVLSKYSTFYSCALTLEELLKIEQLLDEDKKNYLQNENIIQKQQYIDAMEKKLKEQLTKHAPYIATIINSGARGKPTQIRQIVATKGLVQDVVGDVRPISNSYIDGLSPIEVFLSSYGARKGIINRTRSTATTGYLFRKLIYALASVELDWNLLDCKTKRTLPVKITEQNKNLLLSRYIVEGNKKVLLNQENIKKYINKTVELRSPIFCKSLKLCKTCYGEFLGMSKTKYVGILAAQVLGERGSQEIMKVFHIGGVASIKIPDIIKEMSENNPDATDKINRCFYQKEDKLYFKSNINFEIILKYSDYSFDLLKSEFSLTEDSKIIKTINGIEYLNIQPLFADFVIKDNNDSIKDHFEIYLFNEIMIPLSYFTEKNKIKTDDNELIVLKGKSQDFPYFAVVSSVTDDLADKIKSVLVMIERRSNLHNPILLFTNLAKIYGEEFKVAYVHIEILVSQMMRQKNKKEYPARIFDNYDPYFVPIKEIPFLESFILSFLFENLSKSMIHGLINDRVTETPLEKILIGNINEE